METLLSLIGFLLIVGVLAFFELPLNIWVAVLSIFFLVALLMQWIYFPLLVAMFSLFTLISIVFLFTPLRYRFFTAPFLKWFQKQQPALSAAEQQMLEAGGLWWEKQFFTGKPHWEELFALEKMNLTDEEQHFLDHQVETLCQMLDNWEIDQELKNFPEAVWNYIKKERFWGLEIDKSYGGLGFSSTAHSAIISKIASRSYSAAVIVMVPNALGPAEFLKHYGTQQQKDYYLPRAASGEDIACFALTCTNAGSDAISISNPGVICRGNYEGKEVLGIRLNWEKRYITLAPIATLIGLAFRLYDPDHLLGEREDLGITLALIPANTPGVETGAHHQPMNLGFVNGPIYGKDVFIPVDFIIGGVEKVGKGWQMMMECLAMGRGISLPSLTTGVMKFCFRMSGAYAYLRQQFHRPIGEFEGVKQALASIGGLTYLSEATRVFTALAVAKGARPAVASAIAKYHLTEFSRLVVNHTMDIHAGHAIQAGPHNYLTSFYSSVPISITVEGANILTRNLIIFGQGVMRCHPYLRAEIEVAADHKNPHQLKRFDQLILHHIQMVMSEKARSLFYGLTAGKLIQVPSYAPLKNQLRQITRMSTAFALMTNFSLIVEGGKLKLKEALSARLADLLSYLYLATSSIKLFQYEGEQAQDLIFVEWSVDYCLFQFQSSLLELLANFPNKWMGKLLKWIIFPFGPSYTKASDITNFNIADQMQRNLALRERYTKNCYANTDSGDAAGRVELAFQTILKAEPLYQKIRDRLKIVSLHNNCQIQIDAALRKNIITSAEYETLSQAEKLRWNALKVDEFGGKQ